MASKTVDLRITLDSDDPENAYLAAQAIVETLEGMEAVEGVRVLSGVADD